mmetsp:Transcript_15167/g.23410  ORF Transcript_15167/g.23410 Transcript_15167/m.23410 type:complete len:480 (+) Transcript_15167:477-1916(+)
MQIEQMQSGNRWEELSDYQNMVDERTIEPDFYVDNAPDAIFIPNPKGETKTTQIFDRDPFLFDYENEVEPILQVLVGKSIEHARIEVIEEYEARMLGLHKKKFLQLKEAELMETQRLEEARGRKNDEIDRRNLQMRTAKNQIINTEKKMIARDFAKGFLSSFKKDTLQILVDLGTLRKPVDLSVGFTYEPQLYNQVQADWQTHKDHHQQMDLILEDTMGQIQSQHKQAMVKELNKRQDRKKEEMRKKREEEEEKRKRKERREALREKKRLQLLQDQILREVVHSNKQEEYTPKMKIYDVRDPQQTDDGIVLIGGFIGELIITFTCLHDYILSNPQHQNFFFSADTVEGYLTDLLTNDELGFPDQICAINLKRDPNEGGRELPPEHVARSARDPANIADFGLQFLFEVQRDLVLQPEVIEVIYKALCKMALKKQRDPIEPPVMADDLPEDKKEEVTEAINKAKAENAQIADENAKIAKIK